LMQETASRGFFLLIFRLLQLLDARKTELAMIEIMNDRNSKNTILCMY